MTLCVWLLSLSRMFFEVPPCCSLCQCIIPVYSWIISHCVDRPQFVLSIYPLMDVRVVSTFGLLWIVQLWTCVCRYLFDTCFSYLRGIPTNRIAESCGHTVFNSLRDCWHIFHSLSFWFGVLYYLGVDDSCLTCLLSGHMGQRGCIELRNGYQIEGTAS